MNKTTILLAIAGYVGVVFKQIPTSLFNYFKLRHSFSLSVSSNEFTIYQIINEYLYNLNDKIINNNINMKSRYCDNRRENIITLNYGRYVVKLDKFTVMIINKYKLQNKDADLDEINIEIFGINKNKYKKIIMSKLKNEDVSNSIKIFGFAGRYKTNPMNVIKRDLSSVFMVDEDKHRLLQHLDKFISSKNIYNKYGLIYKTGILLYGKPGTGKTSIIRAIASRLEYNILLADLSTCSSEKLIQIMTEEVNKKTIIVFEDIDCFFYDRNVEDGKELPKTAVNLSTLLNVLDGIISPSDVIFVATTNHIERLDSALKREGRFDFKLELKDLDEKLAREMCEYYETNPDEILSKEQFPINPAYLQTKLNKKIKEI